MPRVTQMNLRSVRSSADAVELLKLLGYEANPLPYDVSALGLGGEGIRINSDRSPARGYGVVIAEVEEAPRSLRSVGRRLVEQFHDRPLALVGVRNGDSQWDRLIVVRPRLIEGGSGSVSVAKLTIDVERPTAHDAEVLSELAWGGVDASANHDRIDRALDVERVTKRFFEGLNRHYQRLEASIAEAGEQDATVKVGLERAGGADRVALRIVTQILFCYFLQRKGLVEGDRGWLSRQFRANLSRGSYYQQILEPLFYEALARPGDERPPDWKREGIPFLNGGLFERHYGGVSLPLSDELFSTDEGLLGFLDGWTFTVSEEAADESEVAVDPEMLGKIFENLISDDELRREGTVYTPRAVVQFMCREALVPYLQRAVGIDERLARELLLDDDRLWEVAAADGADAALALARRVDDAVARIRVLDPAVGSGAFLLGMMGELIRLRRLCHQTLEGQEAGPRELWLWKVHSVERSLFGVDINPTAVELCRLRLWLSLLVEEQPGDVHPLPNLEYRTVCADSLRDFVFGVEVQQTRMGVLSLGFDIDDPGGLIALRERYFEAFEPQEKARLRAELSTAEDELVERVFTRALENAHAAAESRARAAREEGDAALTQLPYLRERFASRDRVFPAFLPAFHAPDVARDGGWDIVIMNPPYVGRRQLPDRFDASYRADLARHYGRTYDLMIHFGKRAFEFSRRGGAVSMIFNDSIFTSIDASDFRVQLLSNEGAITLLTVARTRCFEGKAVNGGVVVASESSESSPHLRYVENHGRPPRELSGASIPRDASPTPEAIGGSELWVVDRINFLRLPHRPLFRPSPEALNFLASYEECAAWEQFSHLDSDDGTASWEMISFMPSLDRWTATARRTGFYQSLRSRSSFVLLGLLVEGGPGLQTSDDRRFVAALEGSPEADAAVVNQQRLEDLTLDCPSAASRYRELRSNGLATSDALLEISGEFTDRELRWPRSGLIRVAPRSQVLKRALSPSETSDGVVGDRVFVPFEKADDTSEAGGARWIRQNPLVIDWSSTAVALLRQRASARSNYRKPLLTNQQLWGKEGITYNRVASYLRARLIPEGAIFSDMAPLLRSTIDWLSNYALLALLNSAVLDFAVRTFVSSRMHIQASDLRRLPIPVLADDQARVLDELGRRAVSARQAIDAGGGMSDELASIEEELDAYVRALYGIAGDADLWVVR